MKLYDVTLPISSKLPVWPGDPFPRLTPVASIDAGAAVNLAELRLGTHTGTHLDAPLHVLRDGAATDAIDLSRLIGPAWVCRIPTHVRSVSSRDLDQAGIPQSTRRLLIATGNGGIWDQATWEYTEDYVALSADAAAWLVDRGIDLVGVDYLSVELPGESLAVHHTLLSKGKVIVEGLDLRQVPEGAYQLICLPLKLAGADGAPVRAVLVAG